MGWSITALYRHPVKSLGGESMDALDVTASGPVGDRNWAIIDTERRAIRSAKQWPELLAMRAAYVAEPVADAYDDAVSPVELHSPDGDSHRSTDADVDEWLTAKLGRPCRLSARRPASDREHYLLPRARTAAEIASELDLLDDEVLPDFGATDDELVLSLQTSATPPGSYVDAYPVHLITQRSLDTLAARGGVETPAARFRPNLLIGGSVGDDEPEQGWLGRRVRIGEVELEVRSPTLRCSMPARAQPLLGLDADPHMTQALVHHVARLVGVNAVVVTPGRIRAGDPVEVLAD